MRPDTPRRSLWPVAASAVLGGCAGVQSALYPAGPAAARVSALWWLFCAVAAGVFVLVVGAAAWGLARGRPAPPDGRGERLAVGLVAAAAALTAIILLGLLVASLLTGRAVAAPGADALSVEVIGHQWWWELRYAGPGGQAVDTANEIHIPVGRPVRFVLRSPDVIHSFWVPNLHGKTDLIPTHRTAAWLQADRAGVFRGQCAEFCGLQHAHMSLEVVAEPAERFDAWLAREAAPAVPPVEPLAQRGLQVFLAACLGCHTVRGTPAGGRGGPDLTHVARRRTLGAGTVRNTADTLTAWVADAQHAKPGNLMPPAGLGPEDLRAVAAYVGSLR